MNVEQYTSEARQESIFLKSSTSGALVLKQNFQVFIWQVLKNKSIIFKLFF